jgi:hypothetical protein
MTEQRSSERYVIHRAIDCRPVVSSGDIRWPATICDISLGGIGVSTARRFERDVLLIVQAGNTSDDGFLKLVRVKHVRPERNRQCFHGCAFVSALSTEELTALRDEAVDAPAL